MPEKTLLAQGTQFLSAESIEAIICDQEMDVDETTMFNILSEWVKQDECNLEVGKRLVCNINLCYMKPNHLKFVVKKCGFVAAAAVDAALQEIEEALDNESLDDKEYVLVTGAGDEPVNGTYVRQYEDIGMVGGDVVFVKEGAEDDAFAPDHHLFRRRSTWAITLAVDSSQALYSREVPEGAITDRPPEQGWRAVAGRGLPPTCEWVPTAADQGKLFVAPNVASLGVATVRQSGDWEDHDEGRRDPFTMSMVCTLPWDEGHEDEDYNPVLSMEEDVRRMLSGGTLPDDMMSEEDDRHGTGEGARGRGSV